MSCMVFIDTLTAFVGFVLEVLPVLRHSLVRFLPHLSRTFHEVFRRCYFAYTKLKEDSFIFMATYIPSIVVLSNPPSATQRRTALIAA